MNQNDEIITWYLRKRINQKTTRTLDATPISFSTLKLLKPEQQQSDTVYCTCMIRVQKERLGRSFLCAIRGTVLVNLKNEKTRRSAVFVLRASCLPQNWVFGRFARYSLKRGISAMCLRCATSEGYAASRSAT